MTKLSGKQAKELDRYLNVLAKRLGCKDWDIYVTRDTHPQDGPFANIEFWTGLKQARVKVRCDFHDHSPNQQRSTLVHEVLHCHIGGPIKDTGWDLSGVLEEPALTLFNRYHTERLENATDAISTAIAEHFPLPKLSKAKR